MTDNTNEAIGVADNIVDETTKMEALKRKADMLKISYHPSIGMDKLKEKIEDKLAEQPTVDPMTTGAVGVLPASKIEKRKEAGELVRIILNSRDPNKKDWPGEIFSVGNSTVGFFKKYVPYGTEWHVPKIIYNTIVDKKVQVFVNIKDSRGNKSKEGRLIRAYTVDVLDPLTATELAELATAQAASGRIED
jgi:hypothetical protein